MKAQRKSGAEESVSMIHLEFIQNRADLTAGDGLQEVEAYHRAVFLNHHAADLERLQQQARVHEGRLAHLESRLEQARTRLVGLDRLIPAEVGGVPDVRPTSPWNRWDGAMFGAALLGIVALLVFGVLNISFNLLESGLVTFMENPMRAYFWAALLPVGALAVKVGWDFIEGQRRRELYLWTCLIVGLVGVLSWVGAYASVYPTLSKSTDEQIAGLSVFDDPEAVEGAGAALTSSGAKRIDVIIVASQAVAEIFLSAVLGMYMTVIYARHRPVRLAANPLFTQLEGDRGLLEEAVAGERAALAEARGSENRLQNQLAAFVAFARSMFEKESALRNSESHRHRLLLDQISEQLRSQLGGVTAQEGGGGGNGSGKGISLDMRGRP